MHDLLSLLINVSWKQSVLWDFERYGRTRELYSRWVSDLSMSKNSREFYNDTALFVTIAGGSGMDMLITTGNCLSESMPMFGKCVTRFRGTLLNMPIYYHLFKKPTAKLQRYISEIRTRLSLPDLDIGIEPFPGAWGLYTPGYYILALHFRRVPLGFEPDAAVKNEPQHLVVRQRQLDDFWQRAQSAAHHAREISDCRGEQLLIYFASDDVGLRPAAEERLRRHGRVVSGLAAEDVGHSSAPLWRPAPPPPAPEPSCAADAALCAGAASGGETGADDRAGWEATERERRAAAQRERAADLSKVEWWVLANAQWLVMSPAFSTFSASAAAWGLGPGGRMERADPDTGPPAFRADWMSDSDADVGGGGTGCTLVSAADARQRRVCPNPPVT
jgi:hypothetical protein